MFASVCVRVCGCVCVCVCVCLCRMGVGVFICVAIGFFADLSALTLLNTFFLFVLVLHFDSSLFLTGSNDNSVRLWDVTTKQQAAVLAGHTGSVHGVTSLSFDSSGKYLASGETILCQSLLCCNFFPKQCFWTFFYFNMLMLPF